MPQNDVVCSLAISNRASLSRLKERPKDIYIILFGYKENTGGELRSL